MISTKASRCHQCFLVTFLQGASPPLQHMRRGGHNPHASMLFRDGIPEILSNVQVNQSSSDRKMKIKVLVQAVRIREWIVAQGYE